MLKLPKGLKKKKKGKKSKKNQELFTEEELENYKREQREKQLAEEGTSKKPNDDEWSKFNALTTGIDSILKRTQDDLGRIKEQSFFQRVEPKVVKSAKEREEEKRLQQQKEEQEAAAAAAAHVDTVPTAEEQLAQAVIELSESEDESEEADDIFDTTYIDTLTSGDVQLAYVPESPTEDFDEGPDPFDTAYADKLIKGPEVSSRGKKLVNIGAAVEVLTGRVEKVTTVTSRRPRRGPQNLLLQSFDDGTQLPSECEPISEPIKTLLDDPADDIPGGPIDLSVSLHIAFQKEQREQQELQEQEAADNKKDILSEFDALESEDDEFAELAAESLSKKDEVQHITNVESLDCPIEVSTDWAAFEEQKSEKAKPARPPPPRPEAVISIVEKALDNLEEEFDNLGDDPFDTTFVEKVITEGDDDFDFDPRKDEIENPEPIVLAPEDVHFIKKPIDLLAGSNSDLTQLPIDVPIVPLTEEEREIDPFDTSAVSHIVRPKEVEIKILEQELLSDTRFKHSLSDPDFDPRAEEEATTVEIQIKEDYENTARRKSSLSLNISGGGSQKSVVFALGADLLGSTNLTGKIQKPLTPYYPGEITEETVNEDPFDTSFVPVSNPSQIELNLIERDLLTSLKPSLSDPDFDPRAITPVEPIVKADLLAVSEEHNIKVLTPATEQPKQTDEISFADPFDTSAVDHNILPGRAELKLIETELLPAINTVSRTNVLDSYSDSQELGLGDKVLTPQVPTALDFEEEQDPFDTSIANNLGPGKTEIKLLESELIHQ